MTADQQLRRWNLNYALCKAFLEGDAALMKRLTAELEKEIAKDDNHENTTH